MAAADAAAYYRQAATRVPAALPPAGEHCRGHTGPSPRWL